MGSLTENVFLNESPIGALGVCALLLYSWALVNWLQYLNSTSLDRSVGRYFPKKKRN